MRQKIIWFLITTQCCHPRSQTVKDHHEKKIVCYIVAIVPWLFPQTSYAVPALPSRLPLLLHQHRTAVHDWPLLDGCDACLFLRSAGSRGPAVHRVVPPEPTLSHHLPDSGSCFVYEYHRCEAGDPGSLSAMSNSKLKVVSQQFCAISLFKVYIQYMWSTFYRKVGSLQKKEKKTPYLILFNQQLYSREVFSMVCGGCQRHPLFHPKLREKQNNE